MNQFIKFILLIITAMTPMVDGFTVPNPTDNILVAYKLVLSQEAQFDIDDSIESPFWKYLYNNPSMIDHMVLEPKINAAYSTDPFLSSAGAQVSVWAAWGYHGLYLYIKILDSNWIDYSPEPYPIWATDGFVLFLDKNSSDYMYANPSEFYYKGLTSSTIEFQARFGGNEPPSTFWVYSKDSSWQPTDTAGFRCKGTCNTISEGESLGIIMKVIPSADLSIRIQEWRIPWEYVSYGGIERPSTNDRIAAVFGYNDFEGDQREHLKKLRWLKADPLDSDSCWGDIELSDVPFDVAGGCCLPPYTWNISTTCSSHSSVITWGVSCAGSYPLTSSEIHGYHLFVWRQESFVMTSVIDTFVGNISTMNVTGLLADQEYYCQISVSGRCTGSNSCAGDGFASTSDIIQFKTGQESHIISQANNRSPGLINTSGRIQYSLPAQTTVSLSYYTLRGNRIKTVVNEVQSAGMHIINDPLSGMAPGSYVQVLKLGNARVNRISVLVQ